MFCKSHLRVLDYLVNTDLHSSKCVPRNYGDSVRRFLSQEQFFRSRSQTTWNFTQMQFVLHSTVCIVPTGNRLPTKMFKEGDGRKYSTWDPTDSKAINQKKHTIRVENFLHEGVSFAFVSYVIFQTTFWVQSVYFALNARGFCSQGSLGNRRFPTVFSRARHLPYP